MPFTVALAWLFLRERPRGLQVLGGVVALLGTATIALGRAGAHRSGCSCWSVAAASAWARANVTAKRIGRVDMLARRVWGSLATAGPLLGLSLNVEGPAALATLAHRAGRR
ncbi:hypothetical protein [Methylobacterium sp. ARG-1]|uniref:hypothetical protein n=1 Tax=Methylobacterium sp. ARG-1 TaxID=1692501 RepID=UPI000A4CA454|nr:hypothetical protein [Methylobacterium sp. ARG-1]